MQRTPSQLRTTYDEVATLYDRTRPTYPAELFSDLAAVVGLAPDSRVLEVGCGTGQATRDLARLGCSVTAIDLGQNMVRLAERNLAEFPRVTVECSTFEEWLLPEEPFDLVFSATAFYWVDPSIGPSKAASALRPRGLLATVTTHFIAGGSTSFVDDSAPCYDRFGPESLRGFSLKEAKDIPIPEEPYPGLFEPVSTHRYEAEVAYSTQDYVDLVFTYSDHHALDPERKAMLRDCLGNLIDQRHAGRVAKRYMFELAILRRI